MSGGVARDRIRLAGVRGRGFHGVFEHERREGQEFVVDVELAADLAPAGASDDLADTVNYGEIGAEVLARIEGEPFDLIERLAEVIASDALRHSEVDEVDGHRAQAAGAGRGAVRRRHRHGCAAPSRRARRRRRGGEPASGRPATRGHRPGRRRGARAASRRRRRRGLRAARHRAGRWARPARLRQRGGDRPHHALAHVAAARAARHRGRRSTAGARCAGAPARSTSTSCSTATRIAGTDVTSDLPRLTLPHPRAHERAFVLVPWLEADPDATLRHAGRVVPVADLVAALDTSGVRQHPTDTPPDEGPET